MWVGAGVPLEKRKILPRKTTVKPGYTTTAKGGPRKGTIVLRTWPD